MSQTITIPEIQKIIQPTGNPFTNRILQFEKALHLTESDQNTITFWIAITKAQSSIYETVILQTFSSDTRPFLKDVLEAPLFESAFNIFVNALKQQTSSIPSTVTMIIDEICTLSSTEKFNLAQSILEQDTRKIRAEFKVFIEATLHALLYKVAENIKITDHPENHNTDQCPMCNFTPIASVIDPQESGLRYLLCGMCETKWHKVRSTCHHCGNTGRLELLSLENQHSSMKAEVCPECHLYIKHLDRSTNPLLDPFVEDLLSLDLDLALADQDNQRLSMNFYLG